MNARMTTIAACVAAASLTLTGCNDSDTDSTTTTPDSESAFSLKILHINDHHSHLTESGLSLSLDGIETEASAGGFARVVTKMTSLVDGANTDGVLKLHAGDAITGDLYYTLFKGEADAQMMNQVCFDAFALGNHEFDDGDAGLKDFLDFLASGNCDTAVLAANVQPEVGVSPLAMNSATDYIQAYTVKDFGEERVGIIGIDIANKTKNSSSPDASTVFLDEQTAAQSAIDELQAEGINKIVILSHYQYDNEMALAQALSGVDAIVGGDSHSLLGEGFTELGLNPSGAYPTELRNADGDPVCVVQAWEYSQVVGELNLQFDADGVVSSCAGTPHLLLGDDFERAETDTDINDDGEIDSYSPTGEELQSLLASIEQEPLVSVVTPDSTTASLLAGYAAEIDILKEAQIGESTDDLCLERIPGQGRSQLCSVADTAERGSDISNLVAQAFLSMSLTSDLAIQNAGGVRVDLPAGPITVGDAYTLLPFANTLVELEMSGAEIVQVLEDAYAYAIDPDGSTGAYPYAAGLRWHLDGGQAEGERFTQVEIKDRETGAWGPISSSENYKVVTNDYIASGKDGYLTFGTISETPERVVDTYLDYAQSFVDYVEARRNGVIGKLALEDYSTQSYTAP